MKQIREVIISTNDQINEVDYDASLGVKDSTPYNANIVNGHIDEFKYYYRVLSDAGKMFAYFSFDLLPLLSTPSSIRPTFGFINFRFNLIYFRFYQLPVQFDLLLLSSTTGANRPASGFTNFQFNAHFRYHSDFIYQRIYKITMTLLNPTTNRFAPTFTEAIAIFN